MGDRSGWSWSHIFPNCIRRRPIPIARPRDVRTTFDAKRLARRLLARELLLSFVPEPEQRLWRTLTRSKNHLVRDRVRLQKQVEALLEEMRIKLSSVITDPLGVSGRRILTALSQGNTDPVQLAALGDDPLRCSQEELVDALRGSPEPIHLSVLKLFVERLQLLDKQIQALDKLTAERLKKHEQAALRVVEKPGFGVDSAQQTIAEMGVDAEAFPSPGQFSSWAGICPGSEESDAENKSSRSPKGNRSVRRLLNQAAHAAVKKKGCYFQFALPPFAAQTRLQGGHLGNRTQAGPLFGLGGSSRRGLLPRAGYRGHTPGPENAPRRS